MEMPKPTDAHKRLEKLAGKWEGIDTIHPSPFTAGSTAAGSYDNRIDLDNFFLIMDYLEKSKGVVTFRGHGVVGYDGKQKCYTMHWFDNFGFPPAEPGRGQWEGDKLTFDFRYPDHKGRTTYTVNGREMSFGVYMDMDGKGFKAVIEGKYKKV